MLNYAHTLVLTGKFTAMKSSDCNGPFRDLKFCSFFQLKIKIGCKISKLDYCEIINTRLSIVCMYKLFFLQLILIFSRVSIFHLESLLEVT